MGRAMHKRAIVDVKRLEQVVNKRNKSEVEH